MKRISGNQYIKATENKVYLDKVPIEILRKKCKTPILVFLENKIKKNLKTFKEVFKSVFPSFEGFYSFKANYLPQICNIINSKGIGAEVISLLELKLALKTGFPPDKIIVGGPYLSKDLIKLSLQNKVREIIIYNINDIERVNTVARKLNVTQRLCLRVNSQKYNSRLGITLDDNKLSLLKVINEQSRNIKITTILSHYTSQMNSLEQYRNNLNSIIDNFNALNNYGFKIRNINLGGGFPEATVMPPHRLRKIAEIIKEELWKANIHPKHIFLEPGRYFVGDSGVFITKIINVKEDRWIVLNIGNHICPKFARCSLRFYNASRINDPHKHKTSIAGIVPTDQDVLAKNYFFTKELNRNEIVMVTNVGAYTLTFSTRFPYALPHMFLIRDDKIVNMFDPAINKDFSLN
ncbi:MAG: hypothetical protein GF383_15455 [Candidatus Lokiarchaeota archaeon]|nr:hypothetical protein [Candidatus Lokiarchaeota archaeon]MBD3342946.1 hypothetical protein [Candidatus Lokiarchaeota archaeon]